MLMRFDPFRTLDAISDALGTTGSGRGSVMAMDAYRDGDRFVIHLDVPGIDPKSIDLTVDRNVLTVTAERKWEQTSDQELLVNERHQGRFSRELFLGESLDVDRLEASCDQGVLTITLPVAEQAKPRRVEVSGGSTGEQPIETDARDEQRV
jgi:HSP20 family protein